MTDQLPRLCPHGVFPQSCRDGCDNSHNVFATTSTAAVHAAGEADTVDGYVGPPESWGDPPDDDDQSDEVARRTWQRVDLTAILAGTYVPLEPSVGTRSDGTPMLYGGKVHSVASESEGGKSWFALTIASDELRAGHRVLFIDLEDDELGIVGRLRALGVPTETIAANFAYVRPEQALDIVGYTDLLALLTGRPALVVLDGVTEAMVLQGLDPLSNRDAALFSAQLPRRLARCGAAVLLLDHVPKDTDNRGRYAIGAVHKLNGLDGAQFLLENRVPFAVGATGRSSLLLSKDRGGQLRRHGVPTRDRLTWFGDFVLTSHDTTFVEAEVIPPAGDSPLKRPTVLMHRVSEALLRAPEPLNMQGILDRVNGRAEHVRSAVAALVDDGLVTVVTGARGARLHTLVTPFEE